MSANHMAEVSENIQTSEHRQLIGSKERTFAWLTIFPLILDYNVQVTADQ